jgi:hypothetical protein
MTWDHNERRREPRLRLRIGLTIAGFDRDGEPFEIDTKTFDVSPSGAGVELPHSLAVGSVVDVTGNRIGFQARAVVRHNCTDRSTTNTIVGLEFLDGKKLPVVEWH